MVRSGCSNLRRMLRDEIREGRPILLTLKRKTLTWFRALRYIEQTMRYRPQIYPGRITLLISSDSDRERLSRDWRRLSTGGLVVHTVPGDHESYIKKTPEATAVKLRNFLDDAKARK